MRFVSAATIFLAFCIPALGQESMQRSKELGHRSEIFTAEKQPHGFFHKSPWKEKTLQGADEFLVSLGYLQGKATIKVPDKKAK